MKKVKYLYIPYIVAIFFLMLSFGCEKFVEVKPPETFVTNEAVFSSSQTAIAELNSVYADLSAGSAAESILFQTFQSISTTAGLSADEFKIGPASTNLTNQAFYLNRLNADLPVMTFWTLGYRYVFYCNTILEGLAKAKTTDEDTQSRLSPAVKRQLLGEALFLRAFVYYYLVNAFGDVPLLTTTDYSKNNILPRTPKNLVYEQMEKDLLEAKNLLNDKYVDADVVTARTTSERVRPNKWAAAALLSRVYLYMTRFQAADVEASSVIQNSELYSLVSLDNVFLKNSKETIWALQPVTAGYNSTYGRYYILTGAPTVDDGPNPVYLSEGLVNSFELLDPRRSSWINSIDVLGTTYYYPFKYKKGAFDASITTSSKTTNMTEYNMVLRLSEQYLIRAEARAMLNRIDGANGAIADLNAIRTRARGSLVSSVLPNFVDGMGKEAVLEAIVNERRHELFTEWGDRWFDLRRNGRLNGVMQVVTPQKSGIAWQPTQQYYPIPTSILVKNSYLIQNVGY